MEIDDIEKHYERMSDDEIIRITTKDGRGLRPEVFGIIKKEIKKRNLNPDLLNGAIAQNKDYSIFELEQYANILRKLPCPICGKTKEQLNGTIAHTVKGFLFFAVSNTKTSIACPECLDNTNDNAVLSTFFLGWWDLPWGFIKTPVYIYRNIKAKKQNWLYSPNNTLLAFTEVNIGAIEIYKNDKEKLSEIINTQKPSALRK